MRKLFKTKWDTLQQNILTRSPSFLPDRNLTQTLDQKDEKNEMEYIRPMLSDTECNTSFENEENKVDLGLLITQVSRGSISSVISIDLRIQIAEFAKSSRREIERSMFELGEEIGKGNFGKVFKGRVFGLYSSNSKTCVAIKTISGIVNETELENMLVEIKIMNTIRPNLNLVSLIASCSSDLETNGKIFLILEYCNHGDLQKYLQLNGKDLTSGINNGHVDHRCLIKWAFDIANGMQYLNENKIMHGDLAARNILMDENPLKGGYPVAKVADFGLAKQMNDYLIYEKQSRVHVPWRWMAPEYLTGYYFTLASDVWSFGVLFWEILSIGKLPYGRQCLADDLVEKIETGYRLECPKGLEYICSWSPQALFSKISKLCFVSDPQHRGSFSDVVNTLREELTNEELAFYDRMKDTYEYTRSDIYLRLNKR